MRKSVPMVHVSPRGPEWHKAACSEAAGTSASLGQHYRGTRWRSTAWKAQSKAIWTEPARPACVYQERQTFPILVLSLSTLSAAEDSGGERQNACHARAADHLSHREGRPAWSLSAELPFAGQGCTLGATVPSCSPLRGHSPLLGDAHILIGSARLPNAFHLSRRQLLEVVRGQPRGGVGHCITGHQPRVVHHHPGCQVHLLANDCQRESTC